MRALILWLRLPNGPCKTTCLQPSGHRVQVEMSRHPRSPNSQSSPDEGLSNQSTTFSQPLWLAQGWVCDPIGLGLLLEGPRIETSSLFRFLEKLGCRPGAVRTVLPPWGRSCVEMEPTERPTEKKEREESLRPELLATNNLQEDWLVPRITWPGPVLFL